MKITKHGSLSKNQEHKGLCNICGCEFTFIRAEAKYISDQRDGDCLKITCPEPGCGNSVYVAL